MSEANEPENLTLVYLRRMDAKLDKVLDELADLRLRSSETQLGVAALRRDQGVDASTVARLQSNMDLVKASVDRIMRRLDMVE